MGWLQEKQIELVDAPVVIYTDQERTDFMDYWHRHDKEFCSRIQPQLVERFQDEELKFIFQ
jgi:CRISPR/Cas system endoribonuclease Cas6 (RAMP superfamily)